jgi:zinc D-Ala-D-Ala carboxypeptidase
MRLSKHFTLEELCRSQIARRAGIDMTPPPPVVRALERLANEVLEPIRAAIGAPLYISSGFRPIALNTLVRGAKSSAHLEGRAADFEAVGVPLEDAAVLARAACEELPVEKLILEYPPDGWIHVQLEPLGRVPRRTYLVARRGDGATEYRQWA